jgi:hypothetical protein
MIYQILNTPPVVTLGLEFIAVLLYMFVIYLRLRTGARIYSVIGIAILTYLAFAFMASIPMVIAFVALILYSMYDTFFGGN